MGNMRWQDEDQEGATDDQFEEQDLNDQQEQELEDPSAYQIEDQEDFDGQQEQALAVMNEAVLRIEQANLYQTLLNHDLFAKGSARPEIIRKVQTEMRTFILSRLEVLLGIKPDRSQEPAQVQSPFDEQQVEFLQQLADRGIARAAQGNPQPGKPVLNPVQATAQPAAPKPEPEPVRHVPLINPVQAPQQAQPIARPRQQRPAQRQRPAQGQPMNKTEVVGRKQADGSIMYEGKKLSPRRSRPTPPRKVQSNNISEIDGRDYSQAVNPRNPPKPMPSQAVQDQMNAQQVANATSGASAPGQVDMVGLAAKLLTSK